MTEVKHRTVCNRDCPDACGIIATVKDGKAIRLSGDPEHPITQGFLCYRTQHFLDRQYASDRVTTPLLRQGNDFVPISWEQAMALAGNKLRTIKQESGPSAIFHYRSGGSLGLLKHLADYLFEQFGPVTIKRGDICSGAGDAAQLTDFGEEDSHDIHDILHSKHVILWGKNASVSSPHLLPILREAKTNGCKITLIDPVWHKTANHCDRFVQVRPGSDFALAMAIAQIISNEKWFDPQAAQYCDHLDEFFALSKQKTVEQWCAIADVTASTALEIAKALCQEKPCSILVGWGMGRRINGAAIVRALDALCAVSGNIGIPGGGVSFYFKRRGAFDTGFIKGESVAPRTVCEPKFAHDVLTFNNPPIRALWITAGNPVAMLPDSAQIVKAISSREFVVVVDSFLTDTARLAHLVLPTTTLLEDSDVLGSYGHHYLGAARPVVSPPTEVLHELAILQRLSHSLGLGGLLDGTPESWQEKLLGPAAKTAGITIDQLTQSAVRNPAAPKVLFANRVFPTKTGRVNLVTQLPSSLGHVASDTDFPLTLMALSTERSQSSQWARPIQDEITVTVHPDSSQGFPNGSVALLQSRVGSLRVRVQHDERQRKDVALLPKGGHYHTGHCANAIITAQTTDMGEGGALYDEPVRLVAVEHPH